MGSYKVVVKKSAQKEIIKLPKAYRTKVLISVEKLSENPRPHGCEKIRGSKSSYRLRVGDYRVIYTVYDSQLVVSVVRAQHRKEVYRNL